MAAKKATGKTILNTTRSSKERWTYYVETNELVNGKVRYKISEFMSSDHPMKNTVIEWMIEKGVSIENKVETSVQTSDDVGMFRNIIHQEPPGKSRDRLVSMLYGDLNTRTGSKGASRKLRKAVRAMGFARLAALSAI